MAQLSSKCVPVLSLVGRALACIRRKFEGAELSRGMRTNSVLPQVDPNRNSYSAAGQPGQSCMDALATSLSRFYHYIFLVLRKLRISLYTRQNQYFVIRYIGRGTPIYAIVRVDSFGHDVVKSRAGVLIVRYASRSIPSHRCKHLCSSLYDAALDIRFAETRFGTCRRGR